MKENIIFLAPPSAGKGSISAYLKDNYSYEHLSTGDLLREEVKKKTSLGEEINALISNGSFVSDDLITELLKVNLKNITGPFILDGYPRNISQAKTLEKIFQELKINNYKVIYLEISMEEAMKRALGRVICSNCGRSYNLNNIEFSPKEKNICDICGNTLTHRTDDNEETFKNRFETYLENTAPLINFYKEKNNLEVVDATSKEMFKNVVEIIKTKEGN